MTRRTKIIIAVIVLALLIALGVWFWLSRKPVAQGTAPETATNVNVPRTGLPVNGSFSTNVNSAAPEPEAPKPAPEPDSAAALKRLAAAFAERYGSYSNQGDFENQTDLIPLMSVAFAARTESSVEALRAKQQPATYFGVTTRAINSIVDSLDENSGSAVITVQTQRRETDAAGVDTVKYQDIVLTFVKENDTWKADSAKWK